MAQNFQNHAKYVPVFHFFVLPMLLLNVGWEIHRVVVALSAGSVKSLLVALALFLAALYWTNVCVGGAGPGDPAGDAAAVAGLLPVQICVRGYRNLP